MTAGPFADLARRRLADLERHESRLRTDEVYASAFRQAERDRAAREALEAKEARYRFLAAAGVPHHLHDLLVEAHRIEERSPVVEVRRWLRDGCRPAFLILAGGKGVGKTSAACLAISERGGRRMRARELAAASDFDLGFMASLERASLLVVDDLGTESLDAGGWALGRIVGLLDARHEADAPTVITTNLTQADFLARYDVGGGRLRDRLRESARWINVPGESLRRTAP